MNKVNEIYILETMDEDPVYEGFGFGDTDPPSLLGRENLEEDLTPGYEESETIRIWSPVYLASLWKAPKVYGRIATFNDNPGVSCFPAFSKRACDVLHKLLKNNGELLPLDSQDGQYYLFNITKVVDVLDIENSKCEFWCDPPTTAIDIESYSFYGDKLNDLSIFRIYDNPMEVFVTDEFVKTVQRNGLNGFSFKKVWPLPEGTDWRIYNKEHPLAINDSSIAKRKHTFVLILNLSDSKPSKAEIQRLEFIENELDLKLKITSPDEPYFGTYEGSDVVNNEFRCFVSCPDVDKLTKKLMPWIINIDWPQGMYAIKRYGDMHDKDAGELSLVV